ncbi:MAG: amidohydrolase family protein [Treponema sp.]|jgi:imidazolonepropionase-like amidohydrolase|nr:amidohydrolase family protein [Treponema sp.]
MKNTLKFRFRNIGSMLALCAVFSITVMLFFGACSNNRAQQTTAIINAKVFDGENLINDTTVLIKDGYIQAVGGAVPTDAIIIDAGGATLIPGLIDAHVHTNIDGLRDALKFGVTTELAMNGSWPERKRKKVAKRNDIADVRASGMGVVPPGGHPTQYMANSSNLLLRYFYSYPFVSTPNEAEKFIAKQVATGADYIKIFIEDGTIVGHPNLPTPSNETIHAAVLSAHKHNKMALFHATTAAGSKQAIEAGADGLMHLFVDVPHTLELIEAIAKSGAFVVPTLALTSSAFGKNGAALSSDERVRSRLNAKWLDHLSGSINTYPQGNLDYIFASVIALHQAGIDILAGSDVSEPIPGLGGLAHGATLHHELQMLVAAGLEPVEALRAATSIPARRFGLTDRGRIAPGLIADLILIDGNPLVNISDTLSIRSVWHRGELLNNNKK